MGYMHFIVVLERETDKETPESKSSPKIHQQIIGLIRWRRNHLRTITMRKNSRLTLV